MSDTEDSISRYLRRLREERGLTLREAAERAGVSFSRLGEWERGEDSHSAKLIVPPFDVVKRLARAYGVPADSLLRRAGYSLAADLSDDEQGLLANFRVLPPGGKAELLRISRELAERSEAP